MLEVVIANCRSIDIESIKRNKKTKWRRKKKVLLPSK